MVVDIYFYIWKEKKIVSKQPDNQPSNDDDGYEFCI